jgi:hypothetical protein
VSCANPVCLPLGRLGLGKVPAAFGLLPKLSHRRVCLGDHGQGHCQDIARAIARNIARNIDSAVVRLEKAGKEDALGCPDDSASTGTVATSAMPPFSITSPAGTCWSFSDRVTHMALTTIWLHALHLYGAAATGAAVLPNPDPGANGKQ